MSPAARRALVIIAGHLEDEAAVEDLLAAGDLTEEESRAWAHFVSQARRDFAADIRRETALAILGRTS